ncbi:Cysteine-rich repeat secretory protein 9 [Bienertia sinuspersici]
MATSFLSKNQLTLVFIFVNILGLNSQITYLNQACYDDDTSYGSDYKANVNKAVTQHTLEASKTYYNTSTTGVGVDKVNTLFSCRYDISPQTCQKCVASTANNISWCFPSVHGFIIYEECILFYSNLSMSTIMEVLPYLAHYSHRTHNLEVHFSNVLNNTMSDLFKNVISEMDVSSRYFAMTTTNYRSKDTIYALAQCNPDMASFNCSRCLRLGFDILATNYTGAVYGQLFTPLCRLSYMLSNEELSRPWSFFRTFNQTERLLLSAGTINCFEV